MDIQPNLTAALANLRGPSFGGVSGATLRFASLSSGAQSSAPDQARDVVSLSATSSAPSPSAPRPLEDVTDALRGEARRRSQAQGGNDSLAVRRDDLRQTILLRARSGNIGEKALESALARVDARFRGLSQVDQAGSAAPAADEAPTAPPTGEVAGNSREDSARAASLKKHRLLVDKLRKSTSEIDARGKEAGFSAERLAKLKATLHERVRASGQNS